MWAGTQSKIIVGRLNLLGAVLPAPGGGFGKRGSDDGREITQEFLLLANAVARRPLIKLSNYYNPDISLQEEEVHYGQDSLFILQLRSKEIT